MYLEIVSCLRQKNNNASGLPASTGALQVRDTVPPTATMTALGVMIAGPYGLSKIKGHRVCMTQVNF